MSPWTSSSSSYSSYSSRPTKRQRLLEKQRGLSCWMDCESISSVPFPDQYYSSQGNNGKIPSLHSQRRPNGRGGANNAVADSATTSFSGVVCTTPFASHIVKEIFVDRFRKEIIDRFYFSLSCQLRIEDGKTNYEAKERRTVIQKRILVGINACTRALERAKTAASDFGGGCGVCVRFPDGITSMEQRQQQQRRESPCYYHTPPEPLLLVLSSDVSPPRVVAHLPVLARQANVPVLLLPGDNSSIELGRLLGTKKVACVAFMSGGHTDGGVKDRQKQEQEQQQQQLDGDVVMSMEQAETELPSLSSGGHNHYGRDHQDIHDAVDSFVSFMRNKV